MDLRILSTAMGLLWCLLAAGASGQGSTDGTDGEAGLVPNDPQSCLGCHRSGSPIAAEGIVHGAHGVVGNSRSPFAADQQGCQTCHGPSQEHLSLDQSGSRPPPPVVFDERVPAPERDDVCLTCHEDEAGHEWLGSAHAFAEVSCSGCHQVHDEVDRMLSLDDSTGLCLDCHQRQRSELLQTSSHPLRSGRMACTDCHSPHGGPGPADLAAFTVNDQCFTCHAEKRGPFLWEHAPVTEDCTNCHTPHGSNHRNLMQARTPWLCQQCHLAAYHPSNLESGLGVPPRGASSNVLGRDCMNCHVQIHGSNHPSGSGLTR